VTVLRTFSMSAGLEASTVTPGSTAPDASRTIPAIDCAAALRGSARQSINKPAYASHECRPRQVLSHCMKASLFEIDVDVSTDWIRK
jgi:hypothetical protein